MSGPADPWRDERGDPADDLVKEGELLLGSIAGMLDRGGAGLDAALTAVKALDREDLEELVVYVGFLRALALERDREREREARERRERLRRRWRPWLWRWRRRR